MHTACFGVLGPAGRQAASKGQAVHAGRALQGLLMCKPAKKALLKAC